MITMCKKKSEHKEVRTKPVFKLHRGYEMTNWFNCRFLPPKVLSP